MTTATFHSAQNDAVSKTVFSMGSPIYISAVFELNIPTSRPGSLLEIIVLDKMKNELSTIFLSTQNFTIGSERFDATLLNVGMPSYTPTCTGVYTFRIKITDTVNEFEQIDDYNIQYINIAPQEYNYGFRGVFEGLAGMHQTFLRSRESYSNNDGYVERLSDSRESFTGIFVVPENSLEARREGGIEQQGPYIVTKCKIRKNDVIYLPTGEYTEKEYLLTDVDSFGGDKPWFDTANAVDGDMSTSATSQFVSGDNVWIILDTLSSSEIRQIVKVEVGARVGSFQITSSPVIQFTPIFDGTPGTIQSVPSSDGIIPRVDFIDVTNDVAGPTAWTWDEVNTLGIQIEATGSDIGGVLVYAAYIRVTIIETMDRYKVIDVQDYGDVMLCQVVKIDAQ